VGGCWEAVWGHGPRAYLSINKEIWAVLCHSRHSDGAGSPIRGDVDWCHPPYQDGWVDHCSLGGRVFHPAIRAQALTHWNLLGGCCGWATHRVPGASGAVLVPRKIWREDLTWSLGCLSAESHWLTAWRRPSVSFGQSRWRVGRQTSSSRPCGALPLGSGT
jgi:hypothetical protein